LGDELTIAMITAVNQKEDRGNWDK
jgi:hypothetical protein